MFFLKFLGCILSLFPVGALLWYLLYLYAKGSRISHKVAVSPVVKQSCPALER